MRGHRDSEIEMKKAYEASKANYDFNTVTGTTGNYMTNTKNNFTNNDHLNLKLKNQYKNFNTLGNDEDLYSTSNKHTISIKNLNTIKNYLENTGINHNKNASYNNKKVNSKLSTNKKNVISKNDLTNNNNNKFSKLEVRILDHFKNLKNNNIKSSIPYTTTSKYNNINTLSNKPSSGYGNLVSNNNHNRVKKSGNNSPNKNFYNLNNQNNSNINNRNSNSLSNNNSKCYHTYKNKSISIINNEKEKVFQQHNSNTVGIANFASKLNSYAEAKNTNDKSLNNIMKSAKLTIDTQSKINLNTENNMHTKNDSKINILMSEQFKISLDNSVRQNNKSFQSLNSNSNRYSLAKKTQISFDLTNKNNFDNNLSLGERLYRKSVALKELKEKRASLELNKKNLETINNCAFRPQLCDDSVMMNIKVIFNFISSV